MDNRDKLEMSWWLIGSLVALISLFPVSFLDNGLKNWFLGIFGAIIGFLFILSFFRSRQIDQPEKDYLLLFLVWALSALSSANQYSSFKALSLFFLKGIVIAFILPRLIYKVKTIEKLLKLILWVAVFVALNGLVEFALGRNIFFSALYCRNNPYYYGFLLNIPGLWRICGPLGHPLVLASYLVMCLPLAWYFFDRRGEKYHLLLMVILGLGIFLTYSRSATLILLFITALVPLLRSKRKKIVILYYVLLATLVILLFMLVPMAKTQFLLRYSNAFIKKDFLGSYRYYSFFSAWNIFKSNQLLGVGFGNYLLGHNKFGGGILPAGQGSPDNMYLRILAETGLIGFSAFCLVLVNLGVRLVRTCRAASAANKELLYIMALSMGTFLVNIFVFDGFYWLAPNFLFWVIWGLVNSLLNIAREK